MTSATTETVFLPGQLLGTAASHATRVVPIAALGDPVDAVLDGMRERRFDSAAVVAVCDGDRLVGLATLERLLVAAPTTAIDAVMDPRPPTVGPHTDQEHAAWQAFQHGEPGLAVVDDEGGFLGLIPPQ
jgi:magnesium transporter